MGKAILDDAGPLAGKTLTHFYSVSWEGAVPTWTGAFEEEFAEVPRLPIRAVAAGAGGIHREERGGVERFLRDYYKTLRRLLPRQLLRHHAGDLCHQAGLKWHSESGGPWDRKLAAFAEADQLAFLARNDMPQGEFWFTAIADRHGRQLNRPQAMTAHIYGKRLAATEAFTHMVQHWSAYPAVLKPFADAAFCDGVNHFVWHTFTGSPPEFGKPGSEYFAGTHINPNVTWFQQAGAVPDLSRPLPVHAAAGTVRGRRLRLHRRQALSALGPTDEMERARHARLPPGHAYDVITTEALAGTRSGQGRRGCAARRHDLPRAGRGSRLRSRCRSRRCARSRN